MSRPVILTCAVNGGSVEALSQHPTIPISPAEICEAVREARAAGAAVAHIHVRDPDTGCPSNRIDLWREVVARIRDADIEIVLNLTCSMDAIVALESGAPARLGPGTTLATPEARCGHALELRPEIATIDCGTFGVGEDIFVARPSDLAAMAGLMRAAGLRPELECFDLGHVENVRRLMAADALDAPVFIQLCLGTGYGAPGNEAALRAMAAQVPAGAVWAAFECGRRQLGAVPDIVRAGGHVRVGLEDTREMPDGTRASNGALVAEACRLIRAEGHQVASPAQVRRLLNLHGQTHP